MADERSQPRVVEVVVLTDQAGNYYLLDRDTLERARVPEEHAAEVGELLQSDTAGFLGSYQPASFRTAGSFSLSSTSLSQTGFRFFPTDPIRQ